MILIIDGANFAHRARSGFQLGDWNILYNFFRNLRALVEQFKPTRVYFTREGHPKRRFEMLPEYKANRGIDVSTEAGQKKQKTLEDFHRQQGHIIRLLERHFPLSVIRHPDYEADDLIYNVIKNASSANDFVVVSSDTDFIQLLQQFPNVRLYNPITKEFVEAPEYDYVYWKSLRGDGSDNVPKIPGIDDARAEELMGDPDGLRQVLTEHGAEFQRNVNLIRFMEFTLAEHEAVESSSPECDWDAVKSTFDQYGFKSMLKETYWTKFQSVFDSLWNVE